MNPPASLPSDPETGVTAGVLATVAAITAELANPTVTDEVTGAMHRLALVQSLATAIQDAVNDLRHHTTVQIAAIGGAAAKLIETGDVKAWRGTVDALQLATQHSQHRLESLIELSRRSLGSTAAPASPPAN